MSQQELQVRIRKLQRKIFDNFADVPDDELQHHNYSGRIDLDVVNGPGGDGNWDRFF